MKTLVILLIKILLGWSLDPFIKKKLQFNTVNIVKIKAQNVEWIN